MQMKQSLLTILGAALVLTLLAPAATAQTTSTLTIAVSSDVSTGQIKPGIEQRAFKLTPTYGFASAIQNAVTPVSGTLVITITFDCPSGVVISGPGTITMPIPPNSQGGTTTTGTAVAYSLSAARTVPGLQGLTCKLTANTDGLNSQVATKASYTQPIPFTVGYYGLVSASVDNKINDAGPQKQIPYTIQFTNFGNAKTQVNFELAAPATGKWNPVVPDPIILDSPTTAGGVNTGTRTFAIGTPYHNGWNNEETTFTLKMTPVAADAPENIGSVQTASVLARVRGIYVPGPEPMLLVAAILGAALVARLARADE